MTPRTRSICPARVPLPPAALAPAALREFRSEKEKKKNNCFFYRPLSSVPFTFLFPFSFIRFPHTPTLWPATARARVTKTTFCNHTAAIDTIKIK